MSYFAIGTIVTVSVLLSGCVTVFHGSAPTDDGNSIFVAGHRNNRAKVWRCPAKSKGKCRNVNVRFE